MNMAVFAPYTQHKFHHNNFCPDHRMIFATANSKSQKWHLTFCSCGIIENMRSLRSRSRFKIHNDFYIDTVVQPQSTILNTNTIDSEEVYARFLSYFVKVLMKSTLYDLYCIFIYSLVGPSLSFQYSPQRIIRIVTSGPPNYIWSLLSRKSTTRSVL